MNRLLHIGLIVLLCGILVGVVFYGFRDHDDDPLRKLEWDILHPEGLVVVHILNEFHGNTEIAPCGLGRWSGNAPVFDNAKIRIDRANNLLCERGEIACVGEVSVLKDIWRRPHSSWADRVALLPGHGYVVRYRTEKDCYGRPTADGYTYCRICVADCIVSTEGEMIGFTINYQSPFLPGNLPKVRKEYSDWYLNDFVLKTE